MKFTPFKDKIEVRPFKKESNILSDDETKVEAGEVVAVGDDVTFVKVGDILSFDSWGCMKTAEIEGEFHYVVPENSHVILGKYESGK